jgi:hypothetical protein
MHGLVILLFVQDTDIIVVFGITLFPNFPYWLTTLVLFFILNLLRFYIIYCSLSGKAQVEQLIRYIVEEAPEDAEKKRTFK